MNINNKFTHTNKNCILYRVIGHTDVCCVIVCTIKAISIGVIVNVASLNIYIEERWMFELVMPQRLETFLL